jgi:hypothetical protein
MDEWQLPPSLYRICAPARTPRKAVIILTGKGQRSNTK